MRDKIRCWLIHRGRISLSVWVLIGCGFFAADLPQASGQQPAGLAAASATNLWSGLCGSQGMLTDLTQLPSIGCFQLSPGHSATGDFAGHVLIVRVDSQGESCKLDGADFNCSGCIAPQDGCSARLTVHSRDPGGTVNFVIARKVAQGAYVLNQENFDFEQKRLQARTPQPATNPAPGQVATLIPDGPYSSWPEEQKKAVATLSFRCALVSGMQFGHYQGPREAQLEMVQAMTLACVEHVMPDDWPDRSAIQTMEKAHLDKAKALDPALSLPADDVWRQIAETFKAKAPSSAGLKP